MNIATTISAQVKGHDPILHLPIERQLYDYFVGKFGTVTHCCQYHKGKPVVTLDLDGTLVGVEIKKTVKLNVHSKHDLRFGDFASKYPTVTLGLNKDVTKKIDEFVAAVKKVQDLEKRAAAVGPVPDREAIESFLNKQLSTKEVEVHYWTNNIFDGRPIAFYIHPVGKAPADGIMFYFDGQKIIPGQNTKIEDALGHNSWSPLPTDVASMKARIAAVEKLQKKIAAFDPNKSKEFLQLLALKQQADKLLAEFKELL